MVDIIRNRAYNFMALWEAGQIVEAIDVLTEASMGYEWQWNLLNEELKNAYEETYGVQIR